MNIWDFEHDKMLLGMVEIGCPTGDDHVTSIMASFGVDVEQSFCLLIIMTCMTFLHY